MPGFIRDAGHVRRLRRQASRRASAPPLPSRSPGRAEGDRVEQGPRSRSLRPSSARWPTSPTSSRRSRRAPSAAAARRSPRSSPRADRQALSAPIARPPAGGTGAAPDLEPRRRLERPRDRPNSPADREGFGEASPARPRREPNPDPRRARRGRLRRGGRGASDGSGGAPMPDGRRPRRGRGGGRRGGRRDRRRFRRGGTPRGRAAAGRGRPGCGRGFRAVRGGAHRGASHGDPSGNPLGDRFTAEDARSEGVAEYGEADQEHVSEDVDDDHEPGAR